MNRRQSPSVRRGAPLAATVLALLAGWGPSLAEPPPSPALSRGRALYESRCGGCHSLDAHRVGPLHRGLMGRQAGRVPHFDYSAALRASAVMWSASTLETWLRDPEALIPGQHMNYSVESAEDRRLIIQYLGTATHDSPP